MRRAALVGGLVVAVGSAALVARDATPAQAQEFRASPIEAKFNQPAQTTEYEVLITAPPGSKLTFTWGGPACGDYSQPDPNGRPQLYRWHHPHPPCDPTTGHQLTTVTVQISDGKTVFNCAYQGAETGVGRPCTTSQVTTAPGASATTTSPPITTTPVPEPTQAGTGGGSGMGLWAGLGLGALVLTAGGYFAYTRSRSGTVAADPWAQLRYQEQVAQEAVLGEFQSMLKDVNAAWAAYRKAVDTFRSRYSLALSASTEMQGLLVEWAEAQGVAKKQDLAFAIVTLLWSGGSLALKGLRWLRGGQAAAATGEAAAGAARAREAAVAGTEAGTQAVRSATRSEFVSKYLNAVMANRADAVARLAQEAGMTAAEVTARWGDDVTEAGIALTEIVAQQRGWVTMTVEAEATIGRLLVNGRSALAGKGVLAAEDVAQITRWAQQPGFWERLAKAAGRMEEVGWMGDLPEMHEFVGLLYHADDVAFLRRLVDAGGDVAKLRAAMGPAQGAVLGSLDSALAGVVLNAPTGLAATTAAGLAMQGTGDPIGQLGSVTNFVDQFGVTNKIDSMSLPGFIGSELWALVSSPFETYHRYRFTDRAMDIYEQFVKDHADTLGDMSDALNDAVHAMEAMQRALDRHDAGELGSRLRDRAAALRDVLNKMRDAQAGHGGEYEERRAHIEQKLAQIEYTDRALGELRQRVAQMLDWLGSLRDDPSGGRRSLFDMMNPEIAVRMVSIQAFLDLGLASAYQQPPATPAATPTVGPGTPATGNPAPMKPYENPAPVPERPLEELEKEWSENLLRLAEQWERVDSMPGTELPPDGFFDEPPGGPGAAPFGTPPPGATGDAGTTGGPFGPGGDARPPDEPSTRPRRPR